MNPDQARERMVIEQLQRRGISDRRVLKAMREMPRDRFIAAEYAERAYDDGPLPIGAEQTISQPYMVALMTEIAELDGSEKVLEIGTGCGYQTAILARLTHTVYSVEIIPQLQEQAGATLRDLGLWNCCLRLGDGAEGWPDAAPFDVIIVTAGMPGIPRALLAQLAPHGCLIAPVGEEDLQSLVRLRREQGRWQEHYFGECRFVKMAGKSGFDT